MRRKIAVYLLAWLSWSVCARAQGVSEPVPEANPGRPTVSTPATLTPEGYLQFETGLLRASESTEFSTRIGVNEVVKLTIKPRIELILETEPLVYSTAGISSDMRPGEVFAGIQGIALPGRGKRPTISLSYFLRLHASPAPEVDIGTFRQNGTILISGDLRAFHFDGNAILSEQTEALIRRAQYGQTLSVSHPIWKLTVSGEIWHFSQPLLKSNAVGNLWAVGYTLRNHVVVDAGFNRGLTKTSTRWEAFLGFTYLVPHRLWKQ